MAIKGRTPGFLAAALVLLVDQATKILARNLLLDGIPREFIGNAARFTLRYNYGAAFSISWGGTHPPFRPGGAGLFFPCEVHAES